ncbi:MAG: ARMT1-like domain-containing protein [Syntrophomonas sp.]|nr:ARMT1-like domain-containing protein [Syntrophomonas sp.]
MKLSIECLPCLLNQAVRLAKTHLDTEEEQRSLVKRIMLELAAIEDNASAPYVAQKIQRAIKDALQNPDPYREEKCFYNREMLKLEREFSELIKLAVDPLETALKLAAAGNIIDFGPSYDLSREKVLKILHETLKKDFQAETFDSLKSDLKAARKILYIGDNAGEIVFDKMFIGSIKEKYSGLEVDFATRGEAVLNDVTEEDAYFVGMDAYARVINNGTDIPGTVLEHCSNSFQKVFNEADVIIAKGQGNFESLYGIGRDNLYYIFLCKCNLFMERCGAKQNDIMLMRE